ncbi:hypothetical protein BT63DRAFT_277834 [Microthyrium microscopicum]|uniref:Sexual development protein n=1 Tax=Microthyrium microscopicum TaxID=703497 RepID=A0A6A6UAX4_9PEZI|nr:hypothetical protein BT63DRAFT_277834 [Microthyrium microscopicum]
MHSIFSIALVGASLFTGSLAAPTFKANSTSTGTGSYNLTPSGTSSSPPSGTSLSADGFPSPNPDQLKKIELLAHGTLSNAPPPPPGTISAEGLINLRFIEFNENFEVAFFTSLLSNVTNGISGFQISDEKERSLVIEALTAVVAQEELHALNAAGALKSQNQDTILPCKYQFPTTNFVDAITLAATFTDVVLGTLQDVNQIFAQNNDTGVLRGLASIIGQEGEQDAFYRLLQNKNLIPSALPFLTTSTRDFAFSALQAFVVPGSCPNENLISKDLTIFGVLTLDTKNVLPKDQNLAFEFDFKSLLNSNLKFTSGTKYDSSYDWSKASLVYINQQNLPIVEKLQNVKLSGTVVSFEAFFPFSANELNGLTLAAVTTSAGPFASAQAVADASIFAPALIEVN